MILVEKHIINRNHKFFKDIDSLSFASKNLYNYANYLIRQQFIESGEVISIYKLIFLLKTHEAYKDLPAKVSQQILLLLGKNWKSFLVAIKDYNKNPHKYLGRPKLPKYKHKEKGRNILIYTIQAISKRQLKNNLIALSKTNIAFYSKIIKKLQQVRIIPRYSHYVIEVVYKTKTPEFKTSGNKMSIDLGVNNLGAVFVDNGNTYLINGKPLKTVNQFYNKTKSTLMSFIGDKGSSNRIEKLTFKRNMKINDYLHKASKLIINLANYNNVNEIIIGFNSDWKQNIKLGKRNNQNFVNIPFKTYINMIVYKAELEGIKVTLTEESYTSKIDHLVSEPLKKQTSYKGKRIKRGLFKSSTGKIINADINGAIGIMRKVVPNVVEKLTKGIEGIVVFPKLLTITT